MNLADPKQRWPYAKRVADTFQVLMHAEPEAMAKELRKIYLKGTTGSSQIIEPAEE